MSKVMITNDMQLFKVMKINDTWLLNCTKLMLRAHQTHGAPGNLTKQSRHPTFSILEQPLHLQEGKEARAQALVILA